MPDQQSVNGPDHFRPSDYSAALVQCLVHDRVQAKGRRVLDVGCGSGVLLAAAGAAGAAHLTGVDIEADAVAETRALLDQHGYASVRDIHNGALFDPVGQRQFDLVLANLPHFPMDPAAVEGRLPTWSAGGADGRALLDRFLDGLALHLAPDGRALVMHNAFIGLEQTYSKAAAQGLSVSVLSRFLVPLPKPKLEQMTREVLARETGQSIHMFGNYAFGTVAVLCLESANPKVTAS